MKGNKILIGGIVILASEVLWYLYKRLYRIGSKRTDASNVSRANGHQSKENISEVMFFTKESSLCRTHSANNIVCPRHACPVRYTRRLESYINRAEQSVDVCMYAFTCQLLSNAVVNAHKRGVRVRMIMDGRMAENSSSEIAVFHRNGIVIKLESIDGLMHHKFAILDDDIVITGSTNWTMSAFFGNFDHALVSNDRSLVRPFVDEFNRLWKTFSKTRADLENRMEPLAESNFAGVECW